MSKNKNTDSGSVRNRIKIWLFMIAVAMVVINFDAIKVSFQREPIVKDVVDGYVSEDLVSLPKYIESNDNKTTSYRVTLTSSYSPAAIKYSAESPAQPSFIIAPSPLKNAAVREAYPQAEESNIFSSPVVAFIGSGFYDELRSVKIKDSYGENVSLMTKISNDARTKTLYMLDMKAIYKAVAENASWETLGMADNKGLVKIVVPSQKSSVADAVKLSIFATLCDGVVPSQESEMEELCAQTNKVYDSAIKTDDVLDYVTKNPLSGAIIVYPEHLVTKSKLFEEGKFVLTYLQNTYMCEYSFFSLNESASNIYSTLSTSLSVIKNHGLRNGSASIESFITGTKQSIPFTVISDSDAKYILEYSPE